MVAALGRGLDDVVGGMTMVVAVACGGFVAVMRRTPQKWYNMQYINMSGKLPMCRRTGNAQVRYSAAYPTGRELMLRRENYCVTLTVSEGSDPLEMLCVLCVSAPLR